ncbi:hypothetical protein DJ564_31890 [Pseudomonas sp. 31-12]|nr:hypothetical protein DJ564_31890 [Pseudomonas sp. 31-12]
MEALRHIPANYSSIQICRRKSAGGTFVQVRRNSHLNFCRVRIVIRMIRSLGQELSCLNLVPGSPHSLVLRLP